LATRLFARQTNNDFAKGSAVIIFIYLYRRAEMEGGTREFEEKAKKVFSAERKEDIWVLIISAISVILGLAGIITKNTYPSLFF